jgi:hypothetical protein
MRGKRPLTPALTTVSGAAIAALIVILSSAGAASGSSRVISVAPPVATSEHSFPTPIQHVIVIMMENANASWVLQNGSYQRYLAKAYSYAADFYSIGHNSIRDYYAATSGQDWSTLVNHNTESLANTTTAAGETWGGFFQSMPSACDRAAKSPTFKSPTYAYDSGHNPFVWYSSLYADKSVCDKDVVGLGAFESDLTGNTLPNYSLVIPDAWNDSHTICPWAKAWETLVDCGDSYLRSFLPSILNDTSAPWYKSTTVILTYDEANESGPSKDDRGIDHTVGGGIIYTVVAGACANHGYVPTNYSTYSILTTTEWLLNLAELGHHDNPANKKELPMTNMFDFTPGC